MASFAMYFYQITQKNILGKVSRKSDNMPWQGVLMRFGSESEEKRQFKLWQFESPEPLEILQPKLTEEIRILMGAIEEKLVDVT